MFELYDKRIQKNVDLITSSMFLRHRQTPNHLKRVKAHAIWREPSTSVLDDFFQFCRFSETRIKVDVQSYLIL